MACIIQALTAPQIAALRGNPDLTWQVLTAHENKTSKAPFEEPLCEELELDKSWSILQYLLQRIAEEIDSYEELISGDPIGEPGDYYGPYLRDIADTGKLAAFLDPLTVDQLLTYFDGAEMEEQGVYFMGYENVEEDEEIERELHEYAGHHFVALREYVLKAAASGCGLLLLVN